MVVWNTVRGNNFVVVVKPCCNMSDEVRAKEVFKAGK